MGGLPNRSKQSFKNAHCSDMGENVQSSNWYSSLTLVADKNILDSWEACMKNDPSNRGLSCYATKKQNFKNQVHYTIENNDPYNELTRVSMNGVNLDFLTDTTNTLGYGSFELTARITNRNMQSVFSVNAQKEAAGHLNQVSCKVVVRAPVEVEKEEKEIACQKKEKALLDEQRRDIQELGERLRRDGITGLEAFGRILAVVSLGRVIPWESSFNSKTSCINYVQKRNQMNLGSVQNSVSFP